MNSKAGSPSLLNQRDFLNPHSRETTVTTQQVREASPLTENTKDTIDWLIDVAVKTIKEKGRTMTRHRLMELKASASHDRTLVKSFASVNKALSGLTRPRDSYRLAEENARMRKETAKAKAKNCLHTRSWESLRV
jgi:hypothetical protein